MTETKHLGDLGLSFLKDSNVNYNDSPIHNEQIKTELLRVEKPSRVDEEIEKLKR